MVENLRFLGVPLHIAILLVGIFVVMQIVGEILELRGKAVPEILKIRKRFARKRKEREMMEQWRKDVDKRLDDNEKTVKSMQQTLERTEMAVLDILIDTKRNMIIDFAGRVADSNAPVTREQFKRVFKVYKEYEEIILSHHLTNGEVDIAYRMIKESYAEHLKAHSFIEDIRGY